MRALWLADVLRGAGLEVVETAGWRTRGRELTGIVGHMAHHTASSVRSTLATDLHVVTNGNSSAPGPIAQLMLGRDARYYVIASGRCNHAGVGSLPWVPGSGNDWLLATEAVNNGVGEPWSAPMMRSYEIGTAAILTHLGFGAERATTHAEWTTRKIDPAGPTGGRIPIWPDGPRARAQTWSPDGWRAAVAAWMIPPAPPQPELPLPPLSTSEVTKMLIIVGNKDNPSDPRRWVWDGGTSLRYLPSPESYQLLLNYDDAGLVKLHPSFSTLDNPFGMTGAERAEYGQS
jgi:hypothetical protein